MAIEETIAVDVTGLGQLDALADAADRAAEAMAKLSGADLRIGGAGGAGPEALVAQYNAAAAEIEAAIGRISAAQEKLGAAGAGGAAAAEGPERIAAAVDEAAAQVSAGVDKISASMDKLDSAGASAAGLSGELKGLSDAGDAAAAGLGGAADGVKGIGASADSAAAQIAALRGEMAETNAAMAESAIAAGAYADAQGKMRDAQGRFVAGGGAAGAEQAAAQTQAAKQAAADAEASSHKHSMLLLGGAAALAYGIDKAAQLQASAVRDYTSAGESLGNLPMIEQGELKLSGQTDTSQSALASAAYTTESAGFHGQDALAVLRSAAEGAKAENADPGAVANALTTTLTDFYGGPQKSAKAQQNQATEAMNAIIASVGQGKMTLQGLSEALPVILPTGKQAGLSLQQVLGAEATMTGQGMSAQESAQMIRHTITAIQKPSNVQAAEMQMLGINPNQISKDLGSQGLTGTVAEVDAAIQQHMGKGGMVLLDTMNQSKLAMQSAREEISAMPPALQKTAQAYLSGAMTAKQWNQEVYSGSESAKDKNLLQQFGATAGVALGFSSLVKSGMGNKQTEAAALNALMGGQVGQQTALMLGGQHLKTFGDNVTTVGNSAKRAGDNIRGWSQVTDTLSFKLGSFVNQAEALATTAGQVALPAVTDVMKVASGIGGFLASNPEITKPLMAGGGILGAAYALQKVQQPVTTAIQGVGKIAETLHIPGLDKLANVGSSGASGAGLDGAAGALKGAGGSLSGAAGDLSAAAGKLSEGGVLPGKPVPGENEPLRGESEPAIVPPAASAAESTAERDAETAGETGGLALFTRFLGKGGPLAGLPEAASQMVWPAIGAAMTKGIGDQLAPEGSNAGKVTNITQHSGLGGPSNALDIGGWFGMLAEHLPGWSGGATGITAGAGSRFTGIYPSASQIRAADAAATPPPPPPPPPPAPTTLEPYRSAAGLRGTTTEAEADIKAKVTIDTDAIGAAKEKAMTALQGISSASIKPVKVPAPDLSAVQGAAGKAAGDMNGVVGAMRSAAGPAQAAGIAVGQGLAAGIASSGAAAVAAAQNVASQVAATMRTALQTHSPSRVTEAIGEDTSAGLAKGITSGASKVKAAAVTITQSTVNSLVTGLEGGSSAVDAVMTALGTAKPQDIQSITSTVAKLETDLSSALKKGDIGKGEDSALTKMLKADQSKLETLATKRAALEQEISDSQQLATSTIGNASILNAGSAVPTESITAQGADETVQGMQYQAQQQAEFAAQLAKLKKEGLNATSISQIAQGGASAGLPVTEGLVGDKGAISQINQAQQQITKAASQIGNVGGVAGYQSGVQIAKQTAQGLKQQLSQTENQIKAVAQGMTKAVEAAAGGGGTAAAMKAAGAAAGAGFAQGIQSETGAAAAAASALAQAAENAAKAILRSHSPSLLFAGIGGDTAAGFAMGVTAGIPGVQAATARMSQMAALGAAMHGTPAPMTPPSVIQGSGLGGRAPVMHVTVINNISGSVMAANDLATTVQNSLLKQAANNWQLGINLPYKGA